MRRKRTVGLLILCFVGAMFLLGNTMLNANRFPYEYGEQIMGIPIVEDADILADKELQTATDNPGVCFEKVSLPYDKRGILYLSQNMDDEWYGMISSSLEDYYVCMPSDEYWDKKQDAIRDNHSFTLWLVGEEAYYEFELIVTGTPIISVQTSRSEEQEEVDYETDPDKMYFGSETLYYGVFSIFNPGVNTEYYEIVQSHIRYHYKGASAAGFEKKSYAISLQNYEEENIDVSLLGMRSDNSWKLNALCTDENRVREITASQIWEKMAEANEEVNETGPRMEYVELIMDNSYQGLYCLVEPVDKKKLELDENDVLYKMVDWGVPLDEYIQDSASRGWRITYPVRLRYPEEISNYEVAWYPMRDYLNLFYRGNELDKEALAKVNVGNLIDFFRVYDGYECQ